MKPKTLLSLALFLSGIVFSGTIAHAQEVPKTYSSLEARMVQARVVFRGTITNVSTTVLHTNNQFSQYNMVHPDNPARYFEYDIYSYSITLQIDEVLKGQVALKPLKFDINEVQKWTNLEKWAEERASFLWFCEDSEKSIGDDFFGWKNYIFLGPTLPGRTDDARLSPLGPVYDMDTTVLTTAEDVLARARVFAREQVSTTNFHSIWLPNLSDKPYFYDTTLLAVPVVPSLETIATHMIASPNDFASTNADAVVVPESASGLRGCGVEALQYFKSPKNIELLESLLNDDDPARFEAYEVLKGWGIKVPKPEP